MPVIKIETSAQWSCAVKQEVAKKANGIVAEILAKPVAVVQSVIEDGCVIAFGEELSEVSAYVTIAQIGEFSQEKREALTGKLCAFLAEAGLNPKQIYLHFDGGGAERWGWVK